MNRYVLGFLFSTDLKFVALIHKKRPAWQAGKLNGIGGKIERNEVPSEAMRREFREEAGLEVGDWQHFATLRGRDWSVFVFCATSPHLNEIKSVTDEQVTVGGADEFVPFYTHNVHWLIPMARAKLLLHIDLTWEVWEENPFGPTPDAAVQQPATINQQENSI